MDTPNAQWNRTGKGWGLRVTAPGGKKADAGLQLMMVWTTAPRTDVLYCKKATTSNTGLITVDEGAGTILVAKPFELRTSPYPVGVTGLIWPIYQPQLTFIIAGTVTGGTGLVEGNPPDTSAITLIDMNVAGRAWAIEETVCDPTTAVEKKRWFVASTLH